mgnify:CR=1 FL=1
MTSFIKAPVAALALSVLLSAAPSYSQGHSKEITFIHTGDFHGHLIPRPNARSDSNGRMEGGLARVATVIKKIRSDERNAIHVHTGDTIQGSAEVLYTRGQAIVDVVNMFKPDVFAPGNWEFVYGTARFLELFAGDAPKAPWGAISANVFHAPANHPLGTPCRDRTGTRALPAYKIKTVDGVKIGILGLTTDRGPQVVGSSVTAGLCFLRNGNDAVDPTTGATTAGGVDSEVADRVAELRNTLGVDLVVLASEMGLANNVRLAEKIPGIDVVFSSDMHEETGRAVVVLNTTSGGKTILVEEGQDGTMMGKLEVKVRNKQVVDWDWTPIRVDSSISENRDVANKIKSVRSSFVGNNYAQHVNPFNGAKLKRPITQVVGYTTVPLHRSNFSNENMPGVIEGSSHDFLTDAVKSVSGAQIGAIRGFRYGTHVLPGPIKMEDLYHFMPIGPQIAVGTIRGQAVKNQIENAAQGSLNPDVAAWTGGWLFNFSGVTMNIDPYAANGARASNIQVNGAPLDVAANYTYASYWYAADPCLINVVPIPGCTATGGVPSNIRVLKDSDGGPLDGAEVVVKYLESLPNKTASPVLNRITLTSPLPAPKFGNPEVQPLRGATP